LRDSVEVGGAKKFSEGVCGALTPKGNTFSRRKNRGGICQGSPAPKGGFWTLGLLRKKFGIPITAGPLTIKEI